MCNLTAWCGEILSEAKATTDWEYYPIFRIKRVKEPIMLPSPLRSGALTKSVRKTESGAAAGEG